uniref:C2H2-type domain-containing protein n=1 Tax=Trichobilharzia regenti TaxID=157069 RepID=A0AA85IUL7_TRIRE|nr:unnamed protein product [Trichobilharzia regenti]
MLDDLWKKHIIKIKCEKNLGTEQSNTSSVKYLCRICPGFRTDNEALVKSHLVETHQIQGKMHSNLCSCDDLNDLKTMLTTTDENSVVSTTATSNNNGTKEYQKLGALYCQISDTSLHSPTNILDTSPTMNDANSVDSLSPPHSPVSPVLRESNAERKKITITLNSSPPPLPVTTSPTSDIQTSEIIAVISDQGGDTTVSIAYDTLSVANSLNNSNQLSEKQKCPDCDRCFSSCKAFERHILRSHAPNNLSDRQSVDLDSQTSCEYPSTTVSYEFVCPQCDRGFATNQACRIHARVHKQSGKKSARNTNEQADRKESSIESRFRTILPKPIGNKQTSCAQFPLLDLKPRRRNGRRPTISTASSSSSSSEPILLSKKQINPTQPPPHHHQDVGNNSSTGGVCNYTSTFTSVENSQTQLNPPTIFYQSTDDNHGGDGGGHITNHVNLSNEIIYESVTNANDPVCKQPHLLTVAAAYASQLPFSSNDISHNMDNFVTDAALVPFSTTNSSMPSIQIYPIPWMSDTQHNSTLTSSDVLISNGVINQSIDHPVYSTATSSSCDNQFHTVTSVTTNCELSSSSSLTHESLTPYSFIQFYPVMSSDGQLYYMTGTPIEIAQTDPNSCCNHQMEFNSGIVTANCCSESGYEYTTNEIWTSNDLSSADTDNTNNNNNNNNTININSSISSHHVSNTDVNIGDGHHGNNTSSVAYIVTPESCNNNNNKNNEGIIYFSSHYNHNNGVSENCQPILDYLSNDVEVIDLNIPAAVVHLDESSSVSGTASVLGETQLTSTLLYDVNPLTNSNNDNNNNDNNHHFSLTCSDSTESPLLNSTNIITTSSDQQQSLSVMCTVNQNDLSNNSGDGGGGGEQSIFDTVSSKQKRKQNWFINIF